MHISYYLRRFLISENNYPYITVQKISLMPKLVFLDLEFTAKDGGDILLNEIANSIMGL